MYIVFVKVFPKFQPTAVNNNNRDNNNNNYYYLVLIMTFYLTLLNQYVRFLN